ncbi:phage protein [Bifidobacterium cuniculi]|uniref:Phage protein n=1 Tax=Bifidobacterium cuniculi TaxID=1688 RepID=A0A087B3Y5_9BIFI|nr:phage protein [Bifidobacterium cuniculi]
MRPIIEEHILTQPRTLQKRIGPSELGTDCVHCLAAKLAGWERKPSKAAWIPFEGTCIHAAFEQLFSGLGYQTELKVTVGKLDGEPITGSIDLYDEKTGTTVDWKTVGNDTLKAAKANGPSQQYLVQASLYGLGVPNAARSVIVYLPRNAMTLDDAFSYEAAYDPRPGWWALDRAQMLLDLLDLIGRSYGAQVRDAWIRQLPRSTGHCFDCATWDDDPDQDPFGLNQADTTIDLPQRWTRLDQLVEPRYEGHLANKEQPEPQGK